MNKMRSLAHRYNVMLLSDIKDFKNLFGNRL